MELKELMVYIARTSIMLKNLKNKLTARELNFGATCIVKKFS